MGKTRQRIVISQPDTLHIPLISESTEDNPQARTFCVMCKQSGKLFGCLTESSDVYGADNNCLPTKTHLTYHGDSWIPASGQCCDDCLELAFRQKKEGWFENEKRHTVSKQIQKADTFFLEHFWKIFWGWIDKIKQWSFAQEKTVNNWSGVHLEAEGFIEVRVVVSRNGIMHHMEVDFPTDVPIAHLKDELAILIDVPSPAQTWFHMAQRLDETKTLEQEHVDIGAIIEVKCSG